MYTTCLFCNQSLGANEEIEELPIGRRLAFDAAKGRLWVVCRKCERWNLTPIEERWEAIEACERRFAGTRLRMSTDNVGLARLPGGLELVRIGKPQRPEFAAWRYGDQFGRRRRKFALAIAGGVAAGGALVIAGPVTGVLAGGAMNLVSLSLNMFNLYNMSRAHVKVPGEGGATLEIPHRLLHRTRVAAGERPGEWSLEIPQSRGYSRGRFRSWHAQNATVPDYFERLTGETALRAAGVLLPKFNANGAGRRTVEEAVAIVERAGDPSACFAEAAKAMAVPARKYGSAWSTTAGPGSFRALPPAMRLALEMAAHEESERRAMEGELAPLEQAWKEAEEIAAISDRLLVPASVDARLPRG